MIELSIYLSTVAILSGIIVAFVIHNLREPRIKDSISEFKKQITELQEQEKKAMIENSELQAKNHEQQEQITEQARKLSIFSKYTFDPRMSFFRLENKGYCSVCMFTKFKEQQIGIPGNQFKCPSCGTDYSRAAGIVILNDHLRQDK